MVIAHLAEFDARRLWATSGHTSLFVYCTKRLGMAEHAAYKRIAAARAVRKFPAILGWIADGRVHLSAVAALAPHFTPENVQPLLEQAAGKSKYELEKLVAAISPRPDRRDVVRALPLLAADFGKSAEGPQSPPETPSGRQALPTPTVPAIPTPLPTSTTPPRTSAPARASRQRIKPLSPGRVSFNFTGSESLREKLRRVRDLTSHTNPGGRLEILIERIADFYLDRNDPDRTIPRRKKRREARLAREMRVQPAPGRVVENSG